MSNNNNKPDNVRCSTFVSVNNGGKSKNMQMIAIFNKQAKSQTEM